MSFEAGGGSGRSPASPEVRDSPEDLTDREYFHQVMADIADEVEQRRRSGDLPARVEEELQEVFLQFAPPAVREGPIPEELQAVDAAVYVNPVVPVGSNKSGGALIKRSVRSMTLWYVGFVTQQMSQMGASVSRYLHNVEGRLARLERDYQGSDGSAASLLHLSEVHQAESWWVTDAIKALARCPGRVAHLGAGNGWLLGPLTAAGIDAYGVEPTELAEHTSDQGGHEQILDVRRQSPLEHLGRVASLALGGAVVTGVVETLDPRHRLALLDELDRTLSPGATLVLHSMSLGWWWSGDAVPEADLASGHPLRPTTWQRLLTESGYGVQVVQPPGAGAAGEAGSAGGPPATDYLVIAHRPPG